MDTLPYRSLEKQEENKHVNEVSASHNKHCEFGPKFARVMGGELRKFNSFGINKQNPR